MNRNTCTSGPSGLLETLKEYVIDLDVGGKMRLPYPLALPDGPDVRPVQRLIKTFSQTVV